MYVVHYIFDSGYLELIPTGDEQLPICGNCLRAKRYCNRTKELEFRHYTRIPNGATNADDSHTALKNPEIAHLFHHYIASLAGWYDLSDSGASFAKIVPLKALSDKLLFSAVIAFAAVHRSRTRAPSAAVTAERFHENCIKRLISLDSNDADSTNGHALATVCLLRSYELLAEDADPNRHLTGAYALAARNNSFNVINERSLFKAGFYNYLREDITFSLMNRCPLKIDLSSIAIPAAALDDEDQLNIASLYLAETINRTFGADEDGDDETLTANVVHERFAEWCASLPVQFTPYYETEVSATSSCFPTIRMLRDCHFTVLQYCLVTDTLWKVKHDPNSDEIERNAITICGLAFTSESVAVMVNSFGPMSFTCRFLKHTPLQMELIRRLQGCHEATGWPVQRMIGELDQHWKNMNVK